jgi:hypothetical protein
LSDGDANIGGDLDGFTDFSAEDQHWVTWEVGVAERQRTGRKCRLWKRYAVFR